MVEYQDSFVPVDNLNVKTLDTVYSFTRKIFEGLGLFPINLYYLKAGDMQRMGNAVVIYVKNEDLSYVGFGREIFADYDVVADVWLQYGARNEIDKVVAGVHKYVEGYEPKRDLINNASVVWLKIGREMNMQTKLRGKAVYRFEFEIRTYEQVV